MAKNVVLDTVDSCPCLSGEAIANCCGKNGQLFRVNVSTKPVGPQTLYSHPKCYAKATRDCTDKISREHYFSRTILEAMRPLGTVKGFAWLNGKTATIPIDGLASTVLCTRHNAALSPLDSRAGQFYRELVNVDEFLRSDERDLRVRLFSGHDLELWLLKVLCGVVAAGVADHPARDAEIDGQLSEWSRLLFGERMLPPRMGLYAYVPLLHQKEAKHQIACAVISSLEAGVYGLKFDLRDKMFLLVLAQPTEVLPEDSLLRDAIYHPEEFILSMNQSTAHFFFSWSGATTGKAINWNYAES